MIYYIAALLICFCEVVLSEDSTNCIAFFFVTNSLPFESLSRGTVKLNDVEWDRRPIFSDADFTSFDFSNHTFSVSAIAAKRFATALWYPDTREPARPMTNTSVAYIHDDFGLFIYRSNTPVAYNLIVPDRIYVLVASGVPIYIGAFSSELSSSHFGGADVYPLGDNLEVPIQSTNDAGFYIDFYGVHGVDLRSDLRIRRAAEKLFHETNTLFFTNSARLNQNPK